MTLDYDIIIATANRPEILRVSLPSMMRQTRPAQALIIADASDDHEAVVRTVREVTAGAPFAVHVFQAPKALPRSATPPCPSPLHPSSSFRTMTPSGSKTPAKM